MPAPTPTPQLEGAIPSVITSIVPNPFATGKYYQQYIPGLLAEQLPLWVYTARWNQPSSLRGLPMDPRQQRGLMIAALCKVTQKKSGLSGCSLPIRERGQLLGAGRSGSTYVHLPRVTRSVNKSASMSSQSST